jgi:hypothetical protein
MFRERAMNTVRIHPIAVAAGVARPRAAARAAPLGTRHPAPGTAGVHNCGE